MANALERDDSFTFLVPPKKIPDPMEQHGLPSRQAPEDARDQFTGRMMRGVVREVVKEEVRLQLKALSPSFSLIRINTLPNKTLVLPIDALVEADDYGFLARTADLPLYGYGEDPIEAVRMLKREIESLYDDLIEDDSFNGEYLRMKQFLKAAIAE